MRRFELEWTSILLIFLINQGRDTFPADQRKNSPPAPLQLPKLLSFIKAQFGKKNVFFQPALLLGIVILPSVDKAL